ncbi:DHH/RecJ family phosphoesterase [Natronomonas pharaonis DSM 2160]|uniref:DHH/RecJ family phosphoesterase n=1 Tax=Natronomonas pharaonis (strain ATCC 35678 / DSM 2160 / CIP 103997 / JCM 8858 / NBRC 14720 / NCIMB 2260 / Gabara) TaxID=348780 RepID=A0A1U7EX53_NATPD|nr:OB-fold nucleic acid binding domain-containing protein [Natronomonas pharaonis]CAI49703.1 DHH/RecJ family phosphoesterase [Natronomonas pharaonis DSM 2160]
MTHSAAGDAGGNRSAEVVYELAPGCTLEDIEAGAAYLATVNGVVDYGVFVDLSEHVSGLVHESNLQNDHDVGDELVVELVEERENGDLGFEELDADPDEVDRTSVNEGTAARTGDLADHVGETVHLEGDIVQIKQTAGPTIFSLRDGDGVVPCAAFESAGVRAYPAVELDDTVRITGAVETHEGALQLEVDKLVRLRGEAADEVRTELDADLEARAAPADVEPLIEWPAFEKLHDDLADLARRLRRAVLESRPIRLRHHADGDGMCASLPVQIALERFIDEVHHDPDAGRHLLKRLPSKAPFYEMEDVTRDLNFALEDRERHGQRLPLLFMVDNGSTEEDTPAYRAVSEYDIPVLVVDHHHPDPDAVGPLVEQHVNPYLHDEDYRITTGMMCVELARMIDPSLTEELEHVPAVAGLSDRSKADAMDQYLELAADAGYDESDLQDIGEALDYAAHWLRYQSGRNLIKDILNLDCDDAARHRELVSFLADRAERDVAEQIDDAEPHVEHERLDNGAHLYRLDVENHARRFTYPAPGKTTGELHDRKVTETGDPVITIGYGPDFAVLRSDGVRLDIPNMVTELKSEVDGAGVSGGGHLVVGSIKFVPGMREPVIDALVEKMADAELDEDLRSTLVRDD